MEELPFRGRPYIKRYFYTIVLLIAVLITVVRYAVIPYYCNADCLQTNSAYTVIQKILDDFLSSLVVTIGVGSLLLWLAEPSDRLVGAQPIEPKMIKIYLEQAMRDTEYWYFRGGTGTYLKAVTLPNLARFARQRGTRCKVTIDILDPTNIELCELYSRYRNSMASALNMGNDPWTSSRVRTELYATILLVCMLKADEPLLNISIGLSQEMSIFRYDISSMYAIITNEDPQAPAFKIDKGTYFYNSYSEDTILHLEQAKKINLDKVKGLPRNTVELEAVESLFQSIGVLTPDLTQEGLQQIMERALAPKNPYA